MLTAFFYSLHNHISYIHLTHAPYFDQADRRWPTIVAKLFAPLVRDKAVKGFVFLDHSPVDIELRVAVQDYRRFEKRMDALALTLGIHRRPNTATAGQTIGRHAYHGERWLEKARIKQWAPANKRSELVFRFLHAGCALFVDSLVPDGVRWRIEPNSDAKENPLGNGFESLHHLVANYSKSEFDVLLPNSPAGQTATTVWMGQPTSAVATNYGKPGARCHL